MSQRTRVEDAWKALLDSVAAKTASHTGLEATAATTRSVTCAAGSLDDDPNAYRWAILEWETGDHAGEYEVVTASAVADGSATFSWRNGLAAAPEAHDLFTVRFEPLGGATVFRVGVMPSSLEARELPAVFAASERRTRREQVAAGNLQGSRADVLELRTDLISPRSGSLADRRTADELFDQVDALRLNLTGLPGAAQILTPTIPSEIAQIGELDAGQRVHWSVMWTPFRYSV